MEGNDTGNAAQEPATRKGPISGIIMAVAVVIIIVLLVVLGPWSSGEPAGPTPTATPVEGAVTISIDAPASVSAGGEFVASVSIAEVTDFDSAVYDVAYNPAVLEVTAVTNGSIGTTEIPVDMWAFSPVGIQGTARIISNVPGVPGVSGTGSLAEIHFTVVGSSGDTSSVRFIREECSIVDNTATDIPANWVDGSVSVQ